MMVGDEGEVTKVTRAYSHKVKQSQQQKDDVDNKKESLEETQKQEGTV